MTGGPRSVHDHLNINDFRRQHFLPQKQKAASAHLRLQLTNPEQKCPLFIAALNFLQSCPGSSGSHYKPTFYIVCQHIFSFQLYKEQPDIKLHADFSGNFQQLSIHLQSFIIGIPLLQLLVLYQAIRLGFKTYKFIIKASTAKPVNGKYRANPGNICSFISHLTV